LGVDLVQRVTAANRPADDPLPFLLTDGRAVRSQRANDGPWVRVFDVRGALGGRRSVADGEVVIDVTDDDGYAAGRYQWTSGPDESSARRTKKPADIALSVSALGSLYLGGRTPYQLAGAGLVEERKRGGLDRAANLFRWRRLPWGATGF